MTSTNRCFVDSSALIGFFSELDSLHAKAKTALELLSHNKAKFYISDYVVDETLTRIKQKTISVFESHPTPKTFSFTDANILAHMETENIPTLFTFDRDFKNLGVKIVP